ncbi:ATP-dependent RNA helicase DeaD [Vibrio mimicus]|nr:ATP-dependent RNA helicase DeaD [Vibrio mimicus]
MIEAMEREKSRRRERRDDRRDGDRPARREFGGRDQENHDWDTYQLQVGRDQGVQVKDIVGALANELGLTKGSIGAIKLAQGHTFVQLPKAMSSDVSSKLRKLRIRQKEVGAVVCDFDDFRESRGGARREGGPRRDGGRRPEGNREGGFRGGRGRGVVKAVLSVKVSVVLSATVVVRAVVATVVNVAIAVVAKKHNSLN